MGTMKKPRRNASGPRPPRKSAGAPAPPRQADADYHWLEAHIPGRAGLLLYGRVAQEIDEIPPRELWRDLRAAAERYLAAGPDRAAVFQELVDTTQEALIERDQRFGYPPPFCHRGCCRCCHELVYCTSEEARRIHGHCRQAGLAIDYAKLERQLRHVESDEHQDHTGGTSWNDQTPADQSCVFLDADGACSIWPVRPMVCRVHLAEATDAHCLPHNGVEDPEARGISYRETSTLVSAVFSLHRDSVRKTMGRLLLGLRG